MIRTPNLRLEAYHQSTWNEMQGFYGGSFQHTPNAASRLEVTFPNSDGKNSNALHIGQFVRLSLGLAGLPIYPRFYGFVANRAVKQGPGEANISFECLDLLGEAQREQIEYTELGENIDGMDAGAAIKYILGSLFPVSGTAPAGIPDVDGCDGFHTRIITKDDGFSSADYTTKLQLVQAINELCCIDQYPNLPRPYIVYQDGEGRFFHKPVEDIASGYPRFTIEYARNIVGIDQKTRSAKLMTEAIVTGVQDPNDPAGARFVGSFRDNSWVLMEGLWSQKFSRSWASSIDDCRDYAMRKVALYRELYEPVTVELRRGYSLMAGDLVHIHNAATGKDENMRVLEVGITFQPTDFSCKLTLGASNYMPTEYI